MKQSIFKAFFAFALLFSVVTGFAKPPGGDPKCPDDCYTDEQVCCHTAGGSIYFGTQW